MDNNTSCHVIPSTTLINHIPCEEKEIPYELSSVCRFVSPKQDRNSYHLLRDARILPCGHIACLSCIIDAIKRNGGFIQCDFPQKNHVIECKNKHEMTIKDAEILQKNHDFEHTIKENVVEICRFIHNNRCQALNKAERVSICFEHIDNRIASMEATLEIQKESLCQESDKLHDRYIKSTNNPNCAVQKAKIYKSMIKDLNYLFGLVESQKRVIIDNFGCFNLFDHNKIQTNDVKIIQMLTNMKSLIGICELSEGKLAIYGEAKNSVDGTATNINDRRVIEIFSRTFKFIKELSPVEANGYNLSSLVKLYNDKHERIYVLLRNQFIECDTNLTTFKRIISKNGIYFKDIACYKDSILIINNDSVEVYNREGKQNGKINLLDNQNEEIDPTNIFISDNRLIVYSNNRCIYIYNFENFNPFNPTNIQLLQAFEARNVVLCVAEWFLFSLDDKNKLICYKWDRKENKYKNEYERQLNIINDKRKSIFYFNPEVFILSEQECIIYCY